MPYAAIAIFTSMQLLNWIYFRSGLDKLDNSGHMLCRHLPWAKVEARTGTGSCTNMRSIWRSARAFELPGRQWGLLIEREVHLKSSVEWIIPKRACRPRLCCVSVLVCARASVFFVSAYVLSVLVCGRLYIHSLLSSARLSPEILYCLSKRVYCNTVKGFVDIILTEHFFFLFLRFGVTVNQLLSYFLYGACWHCFLYMFNSLNHNCATD